MAQIIKPSSTVVVMLGNTTNPSIEPRYSLPPPRADVCMECEHPQSAHTEGCCPFATTLYRPRYADRGQYIHDAMFWMQGRPVEEGLALIMYFLTGGK